jgi:transposase
MVACIGGRCRRFLVRCNCRELRSPSGAQLANRAVDQVRRSEWHQHGKSRAGQGRWIKSVRWSLLKAPDRHTPGQAAALAEVQHANQSFYRAFLLKEELRLHYQLEDRSLAETHLDAWLAWASRSQLKPFIKLAATIRRYRDGILAAIRLGLSNSRMEALNNKVRLLSHRSFASTAPSHSSPSSTSAAPA